jgi:hypothetical protein
MKVIQAYQCDYCHEILDCPTMILVHEEHCDHNPDHKRCFSCEHFTADSRSLVTDTTYYSISIACNKSPVLKKFKATKKVTCKKWKARKENKQS